MQKFYTGVGSRKTPVNVLEAMTECAGRLQQLGFVLRSGGAKGADNAFERGTPDKEVYRPRGDSSVPGIFHYNEDLWYEAMDIASRTHPAWHRCSLFAKALHTRNVFQVLGKDLRTPSRFLLCWTPDGSEYAHETSQETGGTGTAIRIADRFGVPCFNVARPETGARIDRWLSN